MPATFTRVAGVRVPPRQVPAPPPSLWRMSWELAMLLARSRGLQWRVAELQEMRRQLAFEEALHQSAAEHRAWLRSLLPRRRATSPAVRRPAPLLEWRDGMSAQAVRAHEAFLALRPFLGSRPT